jgi:cation transport ATPase
MAIEYPRRFPRTRRQLLWQCAVSALILQPLLIWRFATGRVVISMALAGLVLAAFALAYQGWRFLLLQEQRHPQPTPEMTFVFMLASVYPVAISTFLLILLAEM